MSERTERLVSIPVGGVDLDGELVVPAEATGLVVFAHGSGSGRTSPRNQFVASTIRERGLGTLLFDLFTESEGRDHAARFDIGFLTKRLLAATEWFREHDAVGTLSVVYFGSNTGAAALRAADRRSGVGAVVSRSGRVDLAADRISTVRAPTLLLVGSADADVMESNRAAMGDFGCETELTIVEGADHCFGRPRELEAVAERAVDWFERHL